ncbi:uncharacterized protein LOC135220508 [Macrobrachium nipponense]|uniref:uncharacterized protein LOC135220508 n=1 Tax=Macrobrachium nipponense TaxID=159736 RepID=UPI0030C7B064
MSSTEDNFEGRFLHLFRSQRDLPPPVVRERDLFVYPSCDAKCSNKRRAPAPPDQPGTTEVNSYLISINNLGPVLKKYATLPRKSTGAAARVILTAEKSKLKTSSSTSVLRSMLKSNVSFSTKMDQGMFKTGPGRKNKPSMGQYYGNDVSINHEADNHLLCSRGNEHSGNISHVSDFSKTQNENIKGTGDDDCGNAEGVDDLNLNNKVVPSSLDTKSDRTVESSVQADNQTFKNSVHANHGFPETRYTPPNIRNPTSLLTTPPIKSITYSHKESSPPRELCPKSVSPSRKPSPTRGLGSRVNMKDGAIQAAMVTVSQEAHSNEYHTVNSLTRGCDKIPDQKCSLKTNGYSCDNVTEKTESMRQSPLSSPETQQGILAENSSHLRHLIPASIQRPKNTLEKPDDGVREMNCSGKEFPPYYVKQSPIYEEVDVQRPGNSKLPSYHPSSNVQSICHDDNMDIPPAPANSPVILNKACHRKKRSPPPKPPSVSNTETARKKKTPPPKPPRKRRSLAPETGTENASDHRSLEAHPKTSIHDGNDIQLGGGDAHFETGRLIAQDATLKLEQYYFGGSLERRSPKKPHVTTFTSSQLETTPSVPSVVIGPHGSPPHKTKKPKKSKSSKAHALSKSFRYLLVTKFGSFKLTGTTYFSKCNEDAHPRHSRCSKRASFLSLREKMRPRSPTPKRVNSIRIPRVVIDCEQSGWEDDVHSARVCVNSVNGKTGTCHSSATLCVNPNAKVEADYCSMEEECHQHSCSLSTSLSFQGNYNKGQGEYDGLLSKSNQNPCSGICSQSPEKKTRLC